MYAKSELHTTRSLAWRRYGARAVDNIAMSFGGLVGNLGRLPGLVVLRYGQDIPLRGEREAL